MCGCPSVWVVQCGGGHRFELHGMAEPPLPFVETAARGSARSRMRAVWYYKPCSLCRRLGFAVLGSFDGREQDDRVTQGYAWAREMDAAFARPAAEINS